MGLRRRAVLWIERPGLCEWGAYLRIGLPSTVQLCSEWWFWEICAIIVGYLGKESLAAHVTTLNFVALVFMPVIGIQASAATLVGNALGEGQPLKAKQTTWSCLVLMVLVWACIALGLAFGRVFLAAMYTDETAVQHIMHRLLCIFAVVGFFDSTQNVMGGVLRGLGKQNIAAAVYLIAYYGTMTPVGCILAFVMHQGVYGIWYSMGIGTSLCLVIFLIFLRRAKFRELAAAAVAKMQREGQDVACHGL